MKEKIYCNNCKKVFISNYLLDKHLNRKEPCLYDVQQDINTKIKSIKSMINKNDTKSINSNMYICSYCKVSYSNKSNLKKHLIKSCINKNQYIIKLKTLNTEILDINKKIKEYNENLKDNNEIYNDYDIEEEKKNFVNKLTTDEFKKLLIDFNNKDKINTQQNAQTINNNVNTNSHNTTNNNIENQQNITNINLVLNNYDEPNCDFLTLEQKNKFLKDRYKGLIDFITYVYFNESYPENHTILYTNLRSKYGHIYKNNKWIVEEIDNIADKLNDYSFDKLSGHLDEIRGDKDKADLFEKEIEKGDKFVEHFTSNDSTKQSRTNIKKLIYNNKDLIERTKEKSVKNKVKVIG
jgi:hypothetical protein